MSVIARYKKADGKFGLHDCEILEDGTVLIKTNEQMLAAAGRCRLDIMILESNGLKVENYCGDVLNVRQEPNASARITAKLAYNDPNTYTIIEVRNGWGLLKSKLGWINLRYTKGASPTPKPVEQKSIDAWAKEVIAGKHGNGHTNRESSLKMAGCTYSYSQVRARVNALLK